MLSHTKCQGSKAQWSLQQKMGTPSQGTYLSSRRSLLCFRAPDSDTPPPRHSSRHNRRPLPYPHEYELLLIADSLCHLGQSECSCVPLHHLCLIYRYRLLPPAIGPPQLQPMSLRSCQGAQLLVWALYELCLVQLLVMFFCYTVCVWVTELWYPFQLCFSTSFSNSPWT